MLFGAISDSHTKSKNTLAQAFSTSPRKYGFRDVAFVFTSKLVLTALRASITLEDIKRLYSICKNLHRVIEGWAFEELQLRLLEYDAKNPDAVVHVRVRAEEEEDAKEEDWQPATLATFDTKAFFSHRKLQSPAGAPIDILNGKIILRPDVTNNESWDALRIEITDKTVKLTFLEVTIQKVHSLSEMVLVQGFKAIEVGLPAGYTLSLLVVHTGLVEAGVFTEFTFKRTSELPTRDLRSDSSAVPEGFKIDAFVATIN